MEPVTELEKKFLNNQLSNAITLTLALKENFELYAYRIIDNEVFTSQTTKIIQDHTNRVKIILGEWEASQQSQNGQLDLETEIEKNK